MIYTSVNALGAANRAVPAGPRQRIVALDVLRGFALCGILLVNIPNLATIRMRSGPPAGGTYTAVDVFDLLVAGRFFPIFSFLFGVSFALFLDTAAARVNHPRLVLLRRLVVLGALGLAHQLLHPGEALVPYAVVGILVLLPASWLPRWVILPGAMVGIVAAVLLDGSIFLIPGMFLLGLAAVRYGVIDALPRRHRQLVTLFCIATVAGIAATVWQAATSTTEYGGRVAAAAGLLGALAYSTGLLLVLATRHGDMLDRILAPMGRMALTNYLSATLLAVAAAPVLGLPGSDHYGRMTALALAILGLQAVASRWWLARHQYGPLEWLWRCLTWWTRTGNRRVPAQPRSSTS